MKHFKLFALLALVMLMSSCSKDDSNTEENLPIRSSSTINSSCGQNTVVDFIAGQNTKAGVIIVYNTLDSVFVTYQLSPNWKMTECHLYVGTLAGVPVNSSGNPKIGNFPINQCFSGYGATTKTFGFKKSNLPACFIVAAHAVVKKYNNSNCTQSIETAWGSGTRFACKGSWASYFNYCIQECCQYETANVVLYAGQNTGIGQISVTNNETHLIVKYTLTGDWFLKQSHLYAGPIANIPASTSGDPNPVLFPFSTIHPANVKVYTYLIPLANLDGCYEIAAHANVAKIVNGVEILTETAWSFGVPFENTSSWGWYLPYCTQYCNTDVDPT